MKLPSKKKLILVGVIVVIAGVIGWNRFKPQAPPHTVTPEVKDLTQVLEVSGYIDAAERADLHFATMSRLAWVGVKEGDVVKKWQTIASVDTQTMRKQLQQQLNVFEKSMRTYDKTVDDLNYDEDPNLTQEYKRILENSQFDLRNAAINVEIQDLAIKLSSLISPIEGIATRIDKPRAGETVGPTDMYQIVNPKTIYFAAVVDEIDIGKIKPQQQATIRLDAFPEDTLSAVVQRIDYAPSTSKGGGTGYKVHFALPDGGENLRYRLGMNGTVSIVVAERPQVLSIPVDTLISRDDKQYVEVLENKQVVRKEVVVGLETDEYAEITSGLSEQSAVILPGTTENK